jgi:hypothetical protein
MKRMLIVLAIFTFIIPAVANAQSLNVRTGNNPALAQIVSSVIANLTGGQLRNQYSAVQVRRAYTPAPSVAYQNGYARGLADARNAAQYTQYGVNNRWSPQNLGNRANGFQRHARGSWHGAY